MNFLSSEILLIRSNFIHSIRTFFQSNGFLEMDTPVLLNSPGMDPHLDPYSVYNPDGTKEGYLVTSPEYSLKQCLAMGIKKIYELSHSFRSGEKGSLHSKEFLMLEFYEVGINEMQLMDRCIELFEYLNTNFLDYGFKKEEVQKISTTELFNKYLKIGIDRSSLIDYVKQNLPDTLPKPEEALYEDLFYILFLNYIEPNLTGCPIFVYDYPPEMASLARIENGLAKRFEIYWNKIELGNAFFELNDSVLQLQRFKEEQILRQKLNKEVFSINSDFQKTLELGLPESSGIAIGIDRLFMIIMKHKDLRFLSPYYTFTE